MRRSLLPNALVPVTLALLPLTTVGANAQNIVLDPGFENAVVGLHVAGRTSGGTLADLGDGAWVVTQAER